MVKCEDQMLYDWTAKTCFKQACWCFILEIVWISWNSKDGPCIVQRQKKFVDKNEEARLIHRFYYTPIRRRLEFMYGFVSL